MRFANIIYIFFLFFKLHYIQCLKPLWSGSCFLNDFWIHLVCSLFHLLPHPCPLTATTISFRGSSCSSGSFQWPVFEMTLWEASLPWLLLSLVSSASSNSYSTWTLLFQQNYCGWITALCVSFSLEKLWTPREQKLSCLHMLGIYCSILPKCSTNL